MEQRVNDGVIKGICGEAHDQDNGQALDSRQRDICELTLIALSFKHGIKLGASGENPESAKTGEDGIMQYMKCILVNIFMKRILGKTCVDTDGGKNAFNAAKGLMTAQSGTPRNTTCEGKDLISGDKSKRPEDWTLLEIMGRWFDRHTKGLKDGNVGALGEGCMVEKKETHGGREENLGDLKETVKKQMEEVGDDIAKKIERILPKVKTCTSKECVKSAIEQEKQKDSLPKAPKGKGDQQSGPPRTSQGTQASSTPGGSDKKEGLLPPQKEAEAEAPSSPKLVDAAPEGRSEDHGKPPLPPPAPPPAQTTSDGDTGPAGAVGGPDAPEPTSRTPAGEAPKVEPADSITHGSGQKPEGPTLGAEPSSQPASAIKESETKNTQDKASVDGIPTVGLPSSGEAASPKEHLGQAGSAAGSTSTDTSNTVENHEQAEASGPPIAADGENSPNDSTQDSVSKPGAQHNRDNQEDTVSQGSGSQNGQRDPDAVHVKGAKDHAREAGPTSPKDNTEEDTGQATATTVRVTHTDGPDGNNSHAGASCTADSSSSSSSSSGGQAQNNSPVPTHVQSAGTQLTSSPSIDQTTVPVGQGTPATLPDTSSGKANEAGKAPTLRDRASSSGGSTLREQQPTAWSPEPFDPKDLIPYTPAIIPAAVGIGIIAFFLWKYFAFLGKKRRRTYRTVRDVPSPPLDEEILEHLQRGAPPADYGYTMVRDTQPSSISGRGRPPRVHTRTIIELHLEVLNECEATEWENVKEDYWKLVVQEFARDLEQEGDTNNNTLGVSTSHAALATHDATTDHSTTQGRLTRDPTATDVCPPHDCDSWSCMEHIDFDAEQHAHSSHRQANSAHDWHTHWIPWIDRNKHIMREFTTQPWFNSLKSEWKQYYQQHASSAMSWQSELGEAATVKMMKLRLWKEWVAQQHRQMRMYNAEEWFQHLLHTVQEETVSDNGAVPRVEKHLEVEQVMAAEHMLRVTAIPCTQPLHPQPYMKQRLTANTWILILALVIEQCEVERSLQEKELYVDDLLEHL
ncbi:hypothetical protein AK88_03345 [Plasmodium fragile]|uniref:Schizont-infected cell agglutination C-terminal domain-containing protein n=1 Tax=Plasmodium fragile TaxID=5857 RepID=A0A0D9QJ45_PLAFR|nr:uncharacterized protein AK88_03345 [Plasmodium fragile]KJP87059.1 hypothetical protein AK88_03345 [Plasmodium fragile]